jgi:hypothetical protein
MTYQVCPTSNDDRQTILELWQRNLPEATEGRYSWLYESGPADDWLLQDECRDAIGSIGLMRRDFHVHNRPVAAGQAVDLNVDQSHRTIGPALQLQRILMEAASEQGLSFVYAVADRRSQLVLRRAGYLPVGDVGRWVKPLKCQSYLARRLRWKPVCRAVSAIVDVATRLSGREFRHRRRKGDRVEVEDRFDQRFDRLWQDAAGRLPILGERSRRFLNWRFANAPDARYRTLTLCDSDDRLRSYLVYHFEGGTAHVADFLYDEPGDLAALLPEFLGIARRWGMESVVVESLVPDSIDRILQQFGFWRRPSSWPLLASAPKAMAQYWEEAGLFDLANWYLTRADVDTDF